MNSRLTTRHLGGMLMASLLTLALTVVACGGEEVVEEVQETVEWSYSGAGGPENWASLSADNARCGEGTQQSPIDITGYELGSSPPISFSYRKEAEAVTNGGHLISVRYPTGNRLGFGERTYQLETVTAHTPSEHHIDGTSYPLELQLLHSQVFGDVAVISMLYEIGEANPVVQEIIDNIPADVGTVDVTGILNARGLMTKDSGYYSYKGSMTSPPCAEPADRFIMLEIGTVSQAQVDALQGLTGPNNRPLQPSNGRAIATSGSRSGP
ncbi:MAG: carbonic anhydrase family protein [Chloroflexi bacterium]|nr:carbonic anhydrase family protein [Chloroflexota bacterium]